MGVGSNAGKFMIESYASSMPRVHSTTREEEQVIEYGSESVPSTKDHAEVRHA